MWHHLLPVPHSVFTKLLSRAKTRLATRVGNGPDPQCGAKEEMGPSPVLSSHWWVLFRDVHPSSFISASPEKAPVL